MKKIITWNINGYRSIVGQNASRKWDKVEKDNKLFRFIDKEKPDVLMLQETKAHVDQINQELRAPEGYNGFFSNCTSRKGYSGAAILTNKEPDEVIFDMGIEEFDCEGRMAGARFGNQLYIGVYFPNGGKGDDRVDYKLRYYDALFDFIEQYKSSNTKVIISGDYNTAHTEIDLARPKQNVNTTGFLQIERDKIDEVLSKGYSDAFRMFNKEGHNYTWWAQRGRAKENNVGWRIDYHMVSDNVKESIKSCYHLPDEPGSDHCPVVMEME